MTIAVNSNTTPTFNQVNAINYGDTVDPLPLTSINNINGSWSPEINNTETTTYTFTPDLGQCAVTTEMIIIVNIQNLDCVEIQTPLNNSTITSLSAPIIWTNVLGAFGYSITIGTHSGWSDIEYDLDLGDVTIYIPDENWDSNTTYYFTITAYNDITNSTNCEEFNFSTKEFIDINYMDFFTPNNNGENDYWNLIGNGVKPQENVYIYDRYGILVAIIDPKGIGWDGKRSGIEMPSTEYWFTVKLNNGNILKGNFSLIRK
jgi:gliding motility-associated-like protein